MNPEYLVAHRGDNTNYPENSYLGIKAALDAGALFVEFDVQMTAGQTLVVLHDSNFKRTANIDQSVFDTILHEIKDLSIHEPKRFADKYKPTPLSTLSEIMVLIAQYPQVTAFVEIKEESLDFFGLQVVMKKLLLELTNYIDQVVIISFSSDSIEYTHRHSNLKTGWVLEKYNSDFHQLAVKLKPQYLICNYKKMLNKEPWKGEWQWVVYTVNELSLAKRLKESGILLIETDDIQLLLKKRQIIQQELPEN